MTIEAGETYIFTKTGNEVVSIAPAATYRGQAMWEVERPSGEAAGKRVEVPARALVGPTELHAEELKLYGEENGRTRI